MPLGNEINKTMNILFYTDNKNILLQVKEKAVNLLESINIFVLFLSGNMISLLEINRSSPSKKLPSKYKGNSFTIKCNTLQTCMLYIPHTATLPSCRVYSGILSENIRMHSNTGIVLNAPA